MRVAKLDGRLVLIQGGAALDVADLGAGRFEFSMATR